MLRSPEGREGNGGGGMAKNERMHNVPSKTSFGD
jgi:hypothetical protein